MKRTAITGAVVGLVVGVFLLSGVLALVVRCLPLRIARPPSPWPWYCADPAYGVLLYLAFPVNVLTNDLARGVVLAPLSLAMYMLLGLLIAVWRARRRHPS
ncbi:MAG: hypothetical protein RMN24_14145 [Anaerolineae bacterium]|nr:hypothetical protein [Caldilineales bacterium]MCX7851495.1 hypothetical protein [Caldilineales bacterium]MDW8270297.1 hypothetical protein [Anaerolineae bacterium]